jgi:hypothetical protein
MKVVIFSLSLPIILFRYALINFAEGGESLAVCEYDNELARTVKKQVIFFIVRVTSYLGICSIVTNFVI